MKYRKPELLDIGARMERADGQVAPHACVSGVAAGEWETCGNGLTAGWVCMTGGSPGPYVSCIPGGAAAGNADCLSGSVVSDYCENGSSGANDPSGCNNGPSYS